MSKEANQDGQDSEELSTREWFISISVSATIFCFSVWTVSSYESAQQGYKWIVLGLVALFSGGIAVVGIFSIIWKWFKGLKIFTFISESGWWTALISLTPGVLLNVMGVLRLYESFERPDANDDGMFTISDIGIHAKETFFASGDVFTRWVSSTDVGLFFEMDIYTPNPGLSFIVSAILWCFLYFPVTSLIEKS